MNKNIALEYLQVMQCYAVKCIEVLNSNIPKQSM